MAATIREAWDAAEELRWSALGGDLVQLNGGPLRREQLHLDPLTGELRELTEFEYARAVMWEAIGKPDGRGDVLWPGTWAWRASGGFLVDLGWYADRRAPSEARRRIQRQASKSGPAQPEPSRRTAARVTPRESAAETEVQLR